MMAKNVVKHVTPGCETIFSYLSDILSGRKTRLSDMFGESFPSFPKEMALNMDSRLLAIRKAA